MCEKSRGENGWETDEEPGRADTLPRSIATFQSNVHLLLLFVTCIYIAIILLEKYKESGISRGLAGGDWVMSRQPSATSPFYVVPLDHEP